MNRAQEVRVIIEVRPGCATPVAERSDLRWSAVRESDGARTRGGYWYGVCPHGDYQSESHWRGHAAASLTRHLQSYHRPRCQR